MNNGPIPFKFDTEVKYMKLHKNMYDLLYVFHICSICAIWVGER